MAVTIMTCGLTRAARPTATMLTEKNAATTPMPIAAPSRPLPPATRAATTAMITATPAAEAADRRAILAQVAIIEIAPGLVVGTIRYGSGPGETKSRLDHRQTASQAPCRSGAARVAR